MRTLHRNWLLLVLALGFSAAALVPVAARWCVKSRALSQLDELALADPVADRGQPDPAVMVRVDERDGLLASWQTIGGCGSSGATGTAGIKWIGRGTTGGLFNVQTQANYSTLGNSPYQDHNFFLNTLITRDIGQKW